MLVAAAVCPHPPLLVPQVAAGAAGELDAVRAACDEAVRRLLAARPDRVVVVGAGTSTVAHPADATGGLAAYGVAWQVRPGRATLPLALTVGAWLLERAGARPSGFQEVSPAVAGTAAAGLGGRLVGGAGRVALLVLGDGSARRTEVSPGYLDARAIPYDDAVARALACVDLDALLALDPALDEQLWVAGRPAWQVLAGAAAGSATSFVGEVLLEAAPYGVGYVVASWLAG